MKSVFVSYNYRDSEALMFADRLNHHLVLSDIEPIDLYTSIYPPAYAHESIVDAINRCSIFICFLDTNNPNVMFELGYAFAKNKQIIIVSDDFKLIPFDVQNSVFIQRNTPLSKLIQQIENRVQDLQEPTWYDELHVGSPVDQLKILATRPDVLDGITPREFEKIIAEWFRYQGCDVTEQPQGPDSGFDCQVQNFRGRTAAVEVKKYKSSSQVSISVVRQLVGAMLLEDLSLGIIVSSAPFTRSALSFVENIGPEILLWTLDDMIHINNLG
ncbi:Restriction endonuclease [Gimesia alba]|uniref:Restriction endonuclease n=1 Tax=Gimesia alba TaxID=2527973 RepID=A0A517RFJ1_9PLAN|nr:restriction endonuclease [Gimesia alba]QDT42615.1 Restriction endonuclease [Gimesia alba]